MKIHLQPSFFGEKERILTEHGDLRVSVFRYDSSVAALRVVSKRGEAVILPYQGQQIWSCCFDGRELAMKSMFGEPVQTQDYFSTYGGFFLHCGVTSIGVPSPGDTHPLHGELPNAPYQSAYICCGEDEKGKYITIGGRYRHCVAFNYSYHADPTVKIYESSTVLDVSMVITNNMKIPMDVNYLGHINFRPVDYARLVYSAPCDAEHVQVDVSVPWHIRTAVSAEDYLAFLNKLNADPALHHIVDPAALYDPQAVLTIKYHADEAGLAHSLQIHPDGYAHYVSHRPDQLAQVLRWIARSPDQDAMGLALPAIMAGDKAESGSITTLAAEGRMRFDMQMGLLNPAETKVIEQKISAITGR